MEEDCLKEIRYHLAYVRSCDVYEKEKEILEEKLKRNVPFLEAKKSVDTYMGENSYASVSRMV